MDGFLKTKRALITPKGYVTTNRTFSYSVAFGVLDEKYFPKNSGWVTNKLTKKIINDYSFDFFNPVDYDPRKCFFKDFEHKFKISVFILCYYPDTNKIYCEKPPSNMYTIQAVVLKLPDGTYACVKNLSRLLGAQISSTTSKNCRYVCSWCLNDFVPGSPKIETHKCTIPKHFLKDGVYPFKKIVEELLGIDEVYDLKFHLLEYDEFVGVGGWNDNIVFEPETFEDFDDTEE